MAQVDVSTLVGVVGINTGEPVGNMYDGLVTDTSSGAAHEIDLSDALPVHDITLTANCTLTFFNIQAGGEAAGRAVWATVVLRQNATGGWTVTWPGVVTWVVGDGSVNLAADAVTFFSFLTVDEGNTWYGFTAAEPTGGLTAEETEDLVGALIDDNSELDWTYDDGTSSIVAVIKTTAPVKHRQFRFVVDGGGSAITTGAKKVYLRAPYDCTIVGWTVLADQSGSIVFDVWKDTYANYPPTVADTITASAKPTVSSATKATSTTLTGWTTSVTEGDVIEINVDSASTITKATLDLHVTVT